MRDVGADFRGCPSERRRRVNNVTGRPGGICQGKHCVLKPEAEKNISGKVCLYICTSLCFNSCESDTERGEEVFTTGVVMGPVDGACTWESLQDCVRS